jgi:hypothetical protein
MAARLILALLVVLLPAVAAAQEPAEPAPEPAPAPAPAEDDPTVRADAAFRRGVDLSKRAQWSEALKAFEEAAAIADSPDVQFNIAYCRRALGRYVSARQAIRAALARAEEMDSSRRQIAEGYLAEFGSVIIRLEVELAPHAATRLSVNGLGLVPSPEDGGAFIAASPAGEGTLVGKRRFTLLLDPGRYLFRAERPGHTAAVVRREYRDGQKARPLKLRLDELPALVSVRSNPKGADVFINGTRQGATPFTGQEYPAGRYELRLEKPDYESYKVDLNLDAGEPFDGNVELVPYTPPLYTRWWFWASGVATAGAIAVVTYFVTRPEPEPPPYDGGSTGWVATPAIWRF